MSPEQWRRVDVVSAAALEKPPEERKRFLNAACAEDSPKVRARIEEFLQLSPEADEPLAKPFDRDLAACAGAVTADLFLQEGTRLSGRYVIRSVLGIGGMGVVYLAEDIKFDPPAPRAVKMISADIALALGAEARSRFKDEANIMARLTDARFVRVYDFDEWDQQPFLVMERVEEGTLEDRPQATWPPKKAAELIASLADAMSAVHRMKISHCDLKPANILLDVRPRPKTTDDVRQGPKIMDFGTAKLRTESGERRSVIGTPGYMAPEQWEEDTDRIGPPADIYALGVILYELLTGALPYDPKDKTDEEFRRAVTDPGSNPPRPRRQGRPVPAVLEAICLKCLAKDPQQRYEAANLAVDLDRWCRDKPPLDRDVPVSTLERLRLWGRRNLTAVAWILALLSLVGLLGWHLAEALHEPIRAQETLASHQARTVHLRLTQLSDGVGTTARDPHLELGALLIREDREGLEKALVRASQQRVDMNGVSPFENWFILNLNGNLLASSTPMEPRPEGVDLRQRDYFQGALRLADQKGGSPVYISRVYQSALRADKRYKFGVSAAVRHGDTIVGVLVATVTTSRKMGLPDIEGEESATALLMQKDPWTLPEETPPPEGASPYLVLLHPAYEQRGSEPVWFPNEQLPEVQAGASDRYRDPVGAVDETYQGRWLAAFAPVADANYVVVVQRRYTPAIPGYWYPLLGSVLAILLTVTVVEYLRRRRRASTTSTVQSTASFLATRPRDR